MRKQIVHNSHVVRDLEARGAVFVDELSSVPEGSNVVFSAHGIAPAVRTEADERGLATIDATCPLVTKVHTQARRYARGRLRDRVDRPRRARGSRGNARRGARGDRPRPVDGGCGARVPPGRPAARVHHADDALGRRDERDRRGTPPPFPADRGARARGHLLRDVEPPVGREGRCSRRSTCSSSSARRTPRTRCASSTSRMPRRRCVSRRRPRRDRRELARGPRDGRVDVGSVGARAARRGALRVVRRARRRS